MVTQPCTEVTEAQSGRGPGQGAVPDLGRPPPFPRTSCGLSAAWTPFLGTEFLREKERGWDAPAAFHKLHVLPRQREGLAVLCQLPVKKNVLCPGRCGSVGECRLVNQGVTV